LVLLFTSMTLQGLSDGAYWGRMRTCICSLLASGLWILFGAMFTIDSQYGSFIMLGWLWYGFGVIFIVLTIALGAMLLQVRQREQEFTVR
jgi:hypothetical protein